MKTRDPVATLRCLSADAVLRMALKAYYAAGASIRADFEASGEPWEDPVSGPWARPTEWVQALAHEFLRRLETAAARLNLPAPSDEVRPLYWSPDQWRAAHHLGADFSGPEVNGLHPAPVACDANSDAVSAEGGAT